MKNTLALLAVLVGAVFAIYGSLSLHTAISGKLDWDGPFAFWIALGAILMVLLIAIAAFHFKQEHRRAYGLVQIVIGSLILVSQMEGFGGSNANHEMFAVKFLAAVFFFVQGFENWSAARVVANGIAARRL